MTFTRVGDDPFQTTWLPARVKQLMLPSFDYFRQPGDTAGKHIVSGLGTLHKCPVRERCTRQAGDSSDEGSSLGHIVNIHSRYKHQKK